MLRLAAARGLDLVQTARMLAMAHVAGGDSMIACFDAKYHYFFWRPYQAIPLADTDGNTATVADPNWTPLGTTPNFPEYPSAHACHSTGVVAALDAFFGTDKVPFTLDSRVTHTTHQYVRLHDVVKDVDWARVLVGFHFRSSDLQGIGARDQGRSLRRQPLLPANQLNISVREAANRRAGLPSPSNSKANDESPKRRAAPDVLHPYLGKGRVSATTSAASTAFGFTRIRVGRLRS